jgi:hypothetical protein
MPVGLLLAGVPYMAPLCCIMQHQDDALLDAGCATGLVCSGSEQVRAPALLG